MDKNNILLIEDDNDSAIVMKEFLEEHLFLVDIFSNATDAIARIGLKKYDLIILDLNLPDYNGFEVMKFLNKEGYKIPIIVLSAYSEIDKKIKAFKYGASDYIVKPVDPNELVARIWVHIGKNSLISKVNKSHHFQIKNRDIFFKNKNLKLTPTEYKILKILIENYGQAIQREYLYNILSKKANKRTLDGHIKNIRKKLALVEKGAENALSTEYGYGYRLLELE